MVTQAHEAAQKSVFSARKTTTTSHFTLSLDETERLGLAGACQSRRDDDAENLFLMPDEIRRAGIAPTSSTSDTS